MNVHETAWDHPNPAPNEDHSFWTKTGPKSDTRVHFVNMFQWLASPAPVSKFFRRILASRRTRRRGSCRSTSMIEHWCEPNNAVSNDHDAPSRTQTIIWQSVYWRRQPQLARKDLTLTSSRAGVAIQLHIASLVTTGNALRETRLYQSCQCLNNSLSDLMLNCTFLLETCFQKSTAFLASPSR